MLVHQRKDHLPPLRSVDQADCLTLAGSVGHFDQANWLPGRVLLLPVAPRFLVLQPRPDHLP